MSLCYLIIFIGISFSWHCFYLTKFCSAQLERPVVRDMIFFDRKETKWTTRKFTLQNIVSGCVVRSKHRIDILNAQSIGKEHLNVYITEQFIEKMISFWDSVKSHRRCSIKKFFLKISQYSQENNYVGVSF